MKSALISEVKIYCTDNASFFTLMLTRTDISSCETKIAFNFDRYWFQIFEKLYKT